MNREDDIIDRLDELVDFVTRLTGIVSRLVAQQVAEQRKPTESSLVGTWFRRVFPTYVGKWHRVVRDEPIETVYGTTYRYVGCDCGTRWTQPEERRVRHRVYETSADTPDGPVCRKNR